MTELTGRSLHDHDHDHADDHVDDHALDRFGALGGLGFTACAIVATAVVPTAPAVDDPAGDIRGYLVDHQARLGVSTVFFAAAALSLVAFLAMLHRRVAATGRHPVAATTV